MTRPRGNSRICARSASVRSSSSPSPERRSWRRRYQTLSDRLTADMPPLLFHKLQHVRERDALGGPKVVGRQRPAALVGYLGLVEIAQFQTVLPGNGDVVPQRSVKADERRVGKECRS